MDGTPAADAAKIFSERTSNVAKRAKLAECLAFLRQGDVLTVTKPHRLCRPNARPSLSGAAAVPRQEGAAHSHSRTQRPQQIVREHRNASWQLFVTV